MNENEVVQKVIDEMLIRVIKNELQIEFPQWFIKSYPNDLVNKIITQITTATVSSMDSQKMKPTEVRIEDTRTFRGKAAEDN